MYKRTYTFTNHHNGSTRSKTILSETPHTGSWEYVSQDNFRYSDFGNGWTTVCETNLDTGEVKTEDVHESSPLLSSLYCSSSGLERLRARKLDFDDDEDELDFED